MDDCEDSMDDYYEDFVDMEPFDILMRYLERDQEFHHNMSPSSFKSKFKRSDLKYYFKVGLGGLEYTCGLLQDLKRLQSDASFSDVTIKVDGKVFHGHRCVLAAASRYFETMFSSGFRERYAKEVELKDMDGDIFELIFSFMYSGKMHLFEDRAIPALRVAAYLGVRNVEKLFVDYFTEAFSEQIFNAEQYFLVWDAADSQGMQELSAEAYKHVLTTFHRIVGTDLFLEKVPFKLLDEYVKRQLRVCNSDCNEEQLLRRIIQWLKHDWENRKGDAYKLMKRFRLGLIPKDKVQELMDDQILEVPECKKMLDDLVKNLVEFKGVDDPLKLPESLLPRRILRTLIAFGGKQKCSDMDDEYDSDDIDMNLYTQYQLFDHYYDKTDGKWTCLYLEFPGTAQELLYPSVVVVNRHLYLAGGLDKFGCDNLIDSKQLFKLDGYSYKWTELPPMKYGRTHFALVHHDGFLYAVGGVQNRRGPSSQPAETCNLNSVERFNLSTQKWDRSYALPMPMAYTSAAVIEGKILVYGMKDRVGKEGEFWLVGFDPVTHKWSEIAQEKFGYAVCRRSLTDSILVVHEGACYRVRYEDHGLWVKKTPHVNRIELKLGRHGLKGCIGCEVEGQDTLPEYYNVNAFHIDGHIYISVGRFAHDTGAILGDPNSEGNFNGWSGCESYGDKCVVEYVFDVMKMRYP